MTVGDYIRLVCDGDTGVLVASGAHDLETIEAAKADILAEYSTLSGAGESPSAAVYKKIQGYRSEIFQINIALTVAGDEFAEACRILARCGVPTAGWKPENMESQLKQAIGALKSKGLRLKQEIERYNKLAADSEGREVTEAGIRREMVLIASDAGHAITDDCNLATYAAYKKVHNERAKALEHEKRRINTAGGVR